MKDLNEYCKKYFVVICKLLKMNRVSGNYTCHLLIITIIDGCCLQYYMCFIKQRPCFLKKSFFQKHIKTYKNRQTFTMYSKNWKCSLFSNCQLSATRNLWKIVMPALYFPSKKSSRLTAGSFMEYTMFGISHLFWTRQVQKKLYKKQIANDINIKAAVRL